MAFAIAAAILGGSALSAGAGIFGSLQASQAQQQGIQQAIQAYQSMTAPFRKAGTEAISPLMKLLTPGPDMTGTLSQLPGLQFMTDWATRTAQNAGSKMGQGGNVLKGIADYASGLAQSNWQSLVNPLLSVAQLGSQAASGAGQGISNLMAAGGQAAGQGIMGAANAVGNLGSSIPSSLLISKLLGGQQTGGLFGSNQPAGININPDVAAAYNEYGG
jgi:hypothetical protein